MRANNLFRILIPAQDKPRIERLRGGDYNRIVGITLPLSKGKGFEGRKLILRVPRWGQGQIERIAATLEYVPQNSSILMPVIVAKDFSNKNPLESPYVVQNWLPGSDLEILWADLNHTQRCTIAREVGRTKRSLLALESRATGYVESVFGRTTAESSYNVVPFELRDTDGDLFGEAEQSCPLTESTTRQTQSTVNFFRHQIARWRAVDVARNADMVDRTVGIWDDMLKVVEEMHTLGLFNTDTHRLCHVDLYPRNIMARILPDSSIEVTGIIDWDEAIVAPKFVNCEPPGWLWGFNPDDFLHEDWPTWPYEMPGANDVPSTPENQELKRIFEEFAGPGYLSLAYHEHYRIARCLFRVALFGLTSSEIYSAADRVIGDWPRLHRSLTC